MTFTAYLALELEFDSPILEALGAYYTWVRTRDYTTMNFIELVDFMWTIGLPHPRRPSLSTIAQDTRTLVHFLKGWSHINPALKQCHTWSRDQIGYYYECYTATDTDRKALHRAIVQRVHRT